MGVRHFGGIADRKMNGKGYLTSLLTKTFSLTLREKGARRMKCDLCYKDKNHVTRVNSWTVCNDCSSSGVLRTALEAQEKIKQLRVQLTTAELRHESHTKLQLDAADRVKHAQEELDAAVNALIPLLANLTDAGSEKRDSLENVTSFESAHPFLANESKS